jgi:hypothetical protein
MTHNQVIHLNPSSGDGGPDPLYFCADASNNGKVGLNNIQDGLQAVEEKNLSASWLDAEGCQGQTLAVVASCNVKEENHFARFDAIFILPTPHSCSFSYCNLTML